MDALRMWKLTVRHDQGTTRITLAATSAEKAKAILCHVEGCPESAIVKVESGPYCDRPRWRVERDESPI